MSSRTSTPKRKLTENVSFIQTNNPEILRMEGRTGGAISIDPNAYKIVNPCEEEKDKKKSKASSQLAEKLSREFKVQTALDETTSLESQDITLPNPLRDAMYMFGVSITGVILMASGHGNIPQDYIKWTRTCLECIKDEYGHHPPNVQGILNYMLSLNMEGGGGDISGKEDDDQPQAAGEVPEAEPEEYAGEQTVVTTTRLRLGSQEEGEQGEQGEQAEQSEEGEEQT